MSTTYTVTVGSGGTPNTYNSTPTNASDSVLGSITSLGGGGGSSGVGGSNSVGGAGGSGVIILSMPDADYSTNVTGSPTVATNAGGTGKTVLTFTGSGSYTT